jgi:methionyl-tRNA formyltransferase
LHNIDLGVDSGSIIGQRHWELESMTTAWDVFLRAQEESTVLLETWIPKLVADPLLPAENQNRKLASYHPQG